ncbi:MAG: formate dehydrogenase accessory sulfurtransferase FdhD [Coriobacteriia bacterium]|nr:formate dehydrogenase accessory sulfurtransferase FdhD [Coriobacteriia bacterium]
MKNCATKIISNNGKSRSSEVQVVEEHNLDLYVNGQLKKTFICINEDLDEIVIGWLIGKALINNYSDIKNINFKDSEVFVETNQKLSVKKQKDELKYKDVWIFDLVNDFHKGTSIHKKTSGTHCAILSVNGKITQVREDIGRHNAVDKIIGYIYKNNIDVNKCIIFTSGRVSSDLSRKIVNAQIPVFVSKSVTSYQAVEIAKGNYHLICKAWPDSFEVYC